MKSAQIDSHNDGFSNSLLHSDCTELLSRVASVGFDFVLTDPPYLVNYTSSDGRTVPNGDNDARLTPAFPVIYRVLRWNRLRFSFYS
jgi:adenine-specific DNA-methyltransferase